MIQLIRQTLDSWIAPTVVFLFALLLFSLHLDRPPHPDELHHVLAAQRLLETGLPLIGEGEYWRGILYTWLVAVSYEVFGEGLSSARMPAVLSVALVSPILFLWVRREAGSYAAWFTAVLFISSPFTVEIAQFSRFYALQMFFFVLGAMCLFYALMGAVTYWRRAWLGALAAILLALAVWTQETSLVGIVAVGVWTLGLVVQRVFFSPATSKAVRRALIALLVMVGVLVLLAATMTEAFDWAWESYRKTQLFNAGNQNEFWFYHVRFFIFYPTLWPLVGLLAVIAVVRSPRFAWFAISVFSISFLMMSFAGPKATRYLSFAPPFLAILWGVGLACVAPMLCRYVATTRDQWLASTGLPERIGAKTWSVASVVALAMVILMNPFWLRTATLIGNVALPFENPATDWRAARGALAPWTKGADIMVTTEELGAIYFLGRSDVRFSPSKLLELTADQQHEFGIDFRTGRPIITKPESLEELIECFERGIIVGPIEHWGNPNLISEAVQAVLVRHSKPIVVPEQSHLYAWGWTRAPGKTKPGYCHELARYSGVREDR